MEANRFALPLLEALSLTVSSEVVILSYPFTPRALLAGDAAYQALLLSMLVEIRSIQRCSWETDHSNK
jgi:hypothetical protein